MIEGRYIYCVSTKSEYLDIDTLGLKGRPVYPINYKDIIAYVSKIPFEEIKADIKAIETHQHVVESSRKRASTLPVKFGVIFKTEDGVRSLLAKSYDDYKTKLTALDNKDEFGLKVLITNQNTIHQPKPKTQKMKGSSTNSKLGDGALYFQKLREEEKRRSDELRKYDKIRGAIRLEMSKNVEQQFIINSDTPQILLNVAYLVDRNKSRLFASNVENVRSRFEPQGLAIHVSGPWAPYSFC